MYKKIIGIFVSAAFVLLASGSAYGKDKAGVSPRPNFVVFLVDDLGWADCSVALWEETRNNIVVRTPNMERLADGGVKFTHAYGSSVCSPSQVTFMTGLSCARHKVVNQVDRAGSASDAECDLLGFPAWNHNGLQPAPNISNSICAATIPEVLAGNGYHTVCIGAHQVAPEKTPGADPCSLGYRSHIHSLETGIEELDGMQKSGVPFFAVVNYSQKEHPVADDDPYYRKAIEDGLPERRARYVAMVAAADSALGLVLDRLKNAGLDRNTTVIMTSDNGGESPAIKGELVNKYNFPLKGGKGSPYEGGIRIPMIIAVPGAADSSSTCDTPVGLDDLFPTIMDIAGAKLPKTAYKPGGVSLLPLLEGDHSRKYNRPLFWHFPNGYTGAGNDDKGAYSAINKKGWKLIYFYRTGTVELYDINGDIFEIVNQGNNPSMSLTRRRLERDLTRELKRAAADVPYDKNAGRWCKYPNGRPFKDKSN